MNSENSNKETMKSKLKKTSKKDSSNKTEAIKFEDLEGKFLHVIVGNVSNPADDGQITDIQDRLVTLFDKNNVNCLILAIQFGYGSPFHLLVKSCQTSEINRRKKLIYKTLHTYSGSQDIDLYGIIYELARRTLPISYSLSKLMKRHQDDYTNSKEVIDYCLTNLELNPRVRLVLSSCNL